MPGTLVIQRLDETGANKIAETSEIVSDEELRLLAAIARLAAGRPQLRQDMQDALAAAANTNLPAATRQIAAGIARTDRAILDLMLVLNRQRDDGAD